MCSARYNRILMTSLVCAAWIGAGVGSARAEDQQQYAQNSTQTPALPAATLHVTGTATRFSISASHADVQDVLKLVFDQAQRQFVPDSSVTGQVTLLLKDQPLKTLLDSVCQQTFLRYRYDAVSGITYFERDEVAVRAAFTQLRNLDALLRDQLRLMGLSLPSDGQLGLQGQGNASRFGGLGGGGGFGGGGFGGGQGGGGVPYLRGGNGLPNGYFSPDQLRSGGAPDAFGRQSPQGQALRRALPSPQLRSKDVEAEMGHAAKPDSKAGRGGRSQAERDTAGNTGNGAAAQQLDAQTMLNLKDQSDYAEFLKQNNFVFFRIPSSERVPVSSVLQQMSQQANVPILVDPNVPSGPKFSIHGTLSPRPLPDALNILASAAHLDWRWINNTVYITTTPEFELFFGASTDARAGYGPPANALSQNHKAEAEKSAGNSRTLERSDDKKAVSPSAPQKKRKKMPMKKINDE
jgi:hypothetical protein